MAFIPQVNTCYYTQELLALYYSCCHFAVCDFQLHNVTSSKVFWLSTSKKGSGWVSVLGEIEWMLFNLGLEVLGCHLVGHFSFCTNGLRKQSSGLDWPPLLAAKLSSRSVCMDVWKLICKWVWLELHICTE